MNTATAGINRASKITSSFQDPFIWSTALASHEIFPAICCSLSDFCAFISVSAKSAFAFLVSTNPLTVSPNNDVKGPINKLKIIKYF